MVNVYGTPWSSARWWWGRVVVVTVGQSCIHNNTSPRLLLLPLGGGHRGRTLDRRNLTGKTHDDVLLLPTVEWSLN